VPLLAGSDGQIHALNIRLRSIPSDLIKLELMCMLDMMSIRLSDIRLRDWSKQFDISPMTGRTFHHHTVELSGEFRSSPDDIGL